MARVSSINTERILWCCSDRNISPAELADAIGMDSDKLRSVIDGNAELTISQLKKLAKFFNRGLLFFLEPGPVREERIRTAGFRTLANDNPDLDPQLKALIERVERQRQVFLSLKEDADDSSVELFNPPPLESNHPKASARTVRTWLGLNGDASFARYRNAVENKGILVFRSNGYNGPWKIPAESTVCGFSIYHKQYPIVFIRKQSSEPRQLFTLMHELAHLLLHARSFVDDEQDLFSVSGKERDANAFAGNVLVPDDFLAKISDSEKPGESSEFEAWLKPYRAKWGVSTEVILRRLLDSQRLNRKEYESYRVWKHNSTSTEAGFGNRAYRYREPKHIFGDAYVKTVLEALHSKQITITRASSYLDNIKIADIHKLERVYNAL